MANSNMEYGVPYRIYKPGKDGNGSASQVETRREPTKWGYDVNTFWSVVKQDGVDKNGNAKFKWKDEEKSKVNIKLSVTDIAKVLLVLRNHAKEVKLFHVPGGKATPTNEGDSTAITFFRRDDGGGYTLQASSKRSGNLVRISQGVTDDEALLLENWFTRVVTSSWDRPPANTVGEGGGEELF